MHNMVLAAEGVSEWLGFAEWIKSSFPSGVLGLIGWGILGYFCYTFFKYRYSIKILEENAAKREKEHRWARQGLEKERREREKEKACLEKQQKEIDRKIAAKNAEISALTAKWFWKKSEKRAELSEIKNNYEKEYQELDKKIEDKQKEIGELLHKIDEEQTKERKINDLCERKKQEKWQQLKRKKMVFIGLTIVAVGLSGEMYSVAHDIIFSDVEKADELEEPQTETEGETDEMEPPEEAVQEMSLLKEDESAYSGHPRKNGYRFILKEGQLNKTLEEEIAALIFPKDVTALDFTALGDTFEEMETERAKQDMEEGKEGQETLIENKLSWIADSLETPFLQRIKAADAAGTQEEWEREAPDSEMLEKIMEERLRLVGREDSGPFRRKLYFQLANDCQNLAQECQIQNKDGETILFYYGMSIYYSCRALDCGRYAASDQTDDYILNYIAARYRDIRDDSRCGRQSEARKIYQAMTGQEG